MSSGNINSVVAKNVPVLEGALNYNQWKIAVKAYMRVASCWEFCENVPVQLGAGDAAALAAWHEKRSRAMGILISTSSGHIQLTLDTFAEPLLM